jgi:hypothetical protein
VSTSVGRILAIDQDPNISASAAIASLFASFIDSSAASMSFSICSKKLGSRDPVAICSSTLSNAALIAVSSTS